MRGIPPAEKALLVRIGELVDAILDNRAPSNPGIGEANARITRDPRLPPPGNITSQTGVRTAALEWPPVDSSILNAYEIEIINMDTGETENHISYTNKFSFKGRIGGTYKARIQSVARSGKKSPVVEQEFFVAEDVMLLEGSKYGWDELGSTIFEDFGLVEGHVVFAWASFTLDKLIGGFVEGNPTAQAVLYRVPTAYKDLSLAKRGGAATLVEAITLYPASISATNAAVDALSGTGEQTIFRPAVENIPANTRGTTYETTHSVMFSPITVSSELANQTFNFFLEITGRADAKDVMSLSLSMWSGNQGQSEQVPSQPPAADPPIVTTHQKSIVLRNDFENSMGQLASDWTDKGLTPPPCVSDGGYPSGVAGDGNRNVYHVGARGAALPEYIVIPSPPATGSVDGYSSTDYKRGDYLTGWTDENYRSIGPNWTFSCWYKLGDHVGPGDDPHYNVLDSILFPWRTFEDPSTSSSVPTRGYPVPYRGSGGVGGPINWYNQDNTVLFHRTWASRSHIFGPGNNYDNTPSRNDIWNSITISVGMQDRAGNIATPVAGNNLKIEVKESSAMAPEDNPGRYGAQGYTWYAQDFNTANAENVSGSYAYWKPGFGRQGGISHQSSETTDTGGVNSLKDVIYRCGPWNNPVAAHGGWDNLTMPFGPGEWHHLVVFFSSGAGINVYVNGKHVKETTGSNNIATIHPEGYGTGLQFSRTGIGNIPTIQGFDGKAIYCFGNELSIGGSRLRPASGVGWTSEQSGAPFNNKEAWTDHFLRHWYSRPIVGRAGSSAQYSFAGPFTIHKAAMWNLDPVSFPNSNKPYYAHRIFAEHLYNDGDGYSVDWRQNSGSEYPFAGNMVHYWQFGAVTSALRHIGRDTGFNAAGLGSAWDKNGDADLTNTGVFDPEDPQNPGDAHANDNGYTSVDDFRTDDGNYYRGIRDFSHTISLAGRENVRDQDWAIRENFSTFLMAEVQPGDPDYGGTWRGHCPSNVVDDYPSEDNLFKYDDD